MAVEIGQVRKGMQVRTSDGTDLGKVAEVWLGPAPTSASARCDEEVCSRVEVRRGLLHKQVIYVPYNAIAGVSGDTISLSAGEADAHKPGWVQRLRWLPGER